jgi:hypothetical protein
MDHLFGEKSDWYPDKFPCPWVNCDGKGELLTSIQPEALAALSVHELTPQEAYVAFNGLGLPEEQDCGPTAVQVAFNKLVKKVNVALLKGTNRSIVNWIEFEDGTRLFLGATAAGAIVYRIAKPRSFTQEALDATQD